MLKRISLLAIMMATFLAGCQGTKAEDQVKSAPSLSQNGQKKTVVDQSNRIDQQEQEIDQLLNSLDDDSFDIDLD